MSNYNKVVELTEEEKLGYEAEVQKYNDLINGVAMETETGENIAIQAVPDQTRFLYKSFNLSMLGRNNEAIKTIMDAQIYYPDSLSLMDFLARTYEQA
ncbi:hypothetical protein KKG31_08500 [Patescibacteria group bacterium]|nr:hypothetical protein [Patescibacteria group bacterium]MBU1759095.1 hypothetical protein [Patescibacteria group bacterium]